MLNLLNESKDSKFVTKKWNIVNANSKSNSDAEVLKYNLCDYNVAYILVRGDIIFRAASATQVVFKDCAPFTKRITKIDETTIDAEDLDSLIPMYNLVEYSSNYSEITGSLRFHSKNEATYFNADIANDNIFKSFEHKAKLLINTELQPNPNHANGISKSVTTAVPLKYYFKF